MVIFHSYVSLPEGNTPEIGCLITQTWICWVHAASNLSEIHYMLERCFSGGI